jgi:hypothetical protein
LIKKTRYIKLSRQKKAKKAKNSKNRKLNGTDIRLRIRPKTTEIMWPKTNRSWAMRFIIQTAKTVVEQKQT